VGYANFRRRSIIRDICKHLPEVFCHLSHCPEFNSVGSLALGLRLAAATVVLQISNTIWEIAQSRRHHVILQEAS
jgi:hypothetical protein